MSIGLFPPVPYPDGEGNIIPGQTIVNPDPGEGNIAGDILSGIGDLLSGITDTVVSLADLAASAFDGALEILDKFKEFRWSFDFMFDFFPAGVEIYVVSIFSIMCTVITFKIVGYFT